MPETAVPAVDISANLVDSGSFPLLPNRISVVKTLQHAFYSQILDHASCLNIEKRISLYRAWKNVSKADKLEVVIIAGGPSFTSDLADAIIKYRKSLDVAAINFYCLNQKSQSLVPNYYILSDPAHLKTSDPALAEKNVLLKRYIKENNCKLCVPYGESWNEYAKPFIHFDDTENLFSSNINPIFPRGYPSNTMFKTIALMIAIGYERIYLVGFDYDYPRRILLDDDNKLILQEEHHYGRVDSNYSNLFDSVGHALHWWAQDYWHLKKLSSSRVINVTENSLVDAFQRMKYNAFVQYLKTCYDPHV